MIDLSRPRRTSPLAAVFGLVDVDRLRGALPLLVVAIGSGQFLPVLALGALAAVVLGALGWWRRTWWFDGSVLHLDEGVLVRNQRRIPVARIQHVELERRLRHQLFELAALRVETAGSSGAELRLDAIPEAEAEALRHAVREALGPPASHVDGGGDPADVGAIAAPGEVLVRLPATRLLLAGITGPEVVAVLTAVLIGLDALADLGVDPTDVESVDLGRALALFLGLVAVPAWFLTAGLIAVVRKWDLTAAVRGDELRVTYGLLRRQEFVMRSGRVQDVRLAHRLLLRPFGRADLRVRSAASGSGESSRIDVPLLDTAEIERVLARVLPPSVPRPSLTPAPPAARHRAVRRGALAGTAVGAVVGAGVAGLWEPAYAPLGAVGPLLGTAWGLAWYRGLGWAEAAGVHHTRVGALTRHTAVVPAARVQSAAVVSTWFQRRRGLATVRLDLAAGRAHVVDRSLREARELAAAVTEPRPDATTGGPWGDRP